MGLFSRSKKKDKKATGGDPPETASSAPNHHPTTGDNDLVVAVLALSSADPTGCCEAAKGIRADADRGRVPASPAIKSGAVAALLALVRGPGSGGGFTSPSGTRGVAGLSAEVAARRREWRERDADRCARHAANALAAIAAADPEGRPALTLVPYLLDITLTRAESPASSRATRGAAAGVLFRLAGEPLGKSAIASRPDAVAGLVSLACESSSVSKRPSMNEDGDECAALDAAGALWMATVRVAGAGVNPNTRGDSGVSTPGGGPSAGGSGFSTPGTVSSQALGAAAGNDAAQVICSHLSHHHLDKLASALVNRHRGGRSAEVDDVVVARLATVLANVCAAPACAANVARSPGTLTSVARALASTRPSPGGSGREGNPWRIRRAAGQSLWNLTAPNETGRVGSSAGSARRRVAAVDGVVDALIEMTLAGCDVGDQTQYSTPNGDEDHLEAVRLGAGTLGAIAAEPAVRSLFAGRPLAGHAVRSALIRAADDTAETSSILPAAVWLLLNAALSPELCEFIGKDEACIAAALKVVATGGPSSVNAAAALARVARGSGACVEWLVSADGPKGRKSEDGADAHTDRAHARDPPMEGMSARYLSAVCRSFLRRYADSDARERGSNVGRSSRKPGAEAWSVAAELISSVVHGDFTRRETTRNRDKNSRDKNRDEGSGNDDTCHLGPWRMLSGPIVDLVVALSCSGDGPTQTAVAPAAEALLAESAELVGTDPGESTRARESGMSACAALLGCARGAASVRVARRVSAVSAKADASLADSLLSHPSLARGLARCVLDACGQSPALTEEEYAADVDYDGGATTMVPLPSPTGPGGALSRLIPVPRRVSVGETGGTPFDSMDANASPRHSVQSAARGWTGPVSGPLSLRGGRDSGANAREVAGLREEEQARREAAEWSIAALRSLAETHVSCRDRIAADPDVLEAASAALLRGGSPLNARAAGFLGAMGTVNGGGVAAALSLGDHSSVPDTQSPRSQGPGSHNLGPRGVSTVSVDALMGMMTNAAADRLTDETRDAVVASAAEAGAALEAVAGHPRGATAIASHATAVTALFALMRPPHPARVSACAARVLRRLVATAPPPVGSDAADAIWSVDSVTAVVDALQRRPDGSEAIEAIASAAWFLAQLAAAADDDESRGDIAAEDGVLESVSRALALLTLEPDSVGGGRGDAVARRNAAAGASAVASELAWTPRVRVVVMSELRGGRMSVGLLRGLAAAIEAVPDPLQSSSSTRDASFDACELGEREPRASAMRALGRLAAADPFLARSLATDDGGSSGGFFTIAASAFKGEQLSKLSAGPLDGVGGVGEGVRGGDEHGANTMWFAAHAACALAVWCAPPPETSGAGPESPQLPADLLQEAAAGMIDLLEGAPAGSNKAPRSSINTSSTPPTPPVSGLRARRGGGGLTIATPGGPAADDPAVRTSAAADSNKDDSPVSLARLECRIAIARVLGRYVTLTASEVESGNAQATSTAERVVRALVSTVCAAGSTPARLTAACTEALRWIAGASNEGTDRLATMIADARGALPALVTVVERGDVAPVPGLGILGSVRRAKGSAGGAGGVAGGSPPVSMRAQTDMSAGHAAIAAAAALGTLAEVARRLPHAVPGRLARIKNAPAALAGFLDERTHARMCAAADRTLVCTASVPSTRALLASAFKDRDGGTGHHRKQSVLGMQPNADPTDQESAKTPRKVTYGDEDVPKRDTRDAKSSPPTRESSIKPASWHKSSAGADGVRVVAADVFAAICSVAPAPTALADPRAILGLARMCRGGPGLGPVERISAARALWSACLAEGDGAWHVEETEGAIASLAALLATGGDESADRESARAARVAAAGALGAVLSGATVSRDESRAVRCANAVCTADGVLAGLTELLRGARKAGTEGGIQGDVEGRGGDVEGALGDIEGALPAAAAVALLTRVPAVAARVVSTEGTVSALVDALHAGAIDDETESVAALLAHAASAVGNIAAHTASAGLLAPAPGLIPGLARLLGGPRPGPAREMAAGAARNLALTAAGRKALRSTPGFLAKVLVSLGSDSVGERHAAVGCLVNLSDDPSSLESLANTPGTLNAITAAANRAMADKDARLRRYVLSVFANLAADAPTRETLSMARAGPTMDAIAKAFVSSRRVGVDPVAQVCGLESLTALAGDEAVDISSLESAATDCATCVLEAIEHGPAYSTPQGPSRAAVAVAASAAAFVATLADAGAGAVKALAGDRLDGYKRLARGLAKLAHPDNAHVFSSQAASGTGTPNHSRGLNSRGPVSSNNSLGSRGPEDAKTSSADSDRDAGVESTAALASLATVTECTEAVASPEPFEALIGRVHAAAAVAARRVDGQIGIASEDSSSELAGAYASAALGSLVSAGTLDETQTLGLLGERAGILGGIIACARIDGDADLAVDPSIYPRSCSFLMMRTCVQIEAPYDDFQTRACRFIFHLTTSRVAARVIVSHPNDALGSLARVLLLGEDGARAAAAAATCALAEHVGPGAERTRMIAVPGLISGLRSALVPGAVVGTYAAAAIAHLAGGADGAAAVLAAAPGVVESLARVLHAADESSDEVAAGTCAGALGRLLRVGVESGASEALVERVNALTMRD